MKRGLLVLLALSPVLLASEGGNRVRYVGGTVAGIQNKSQIRIDLLENDALAVNVHKGSFRIAYRDINAVEYGQRVSRRYVEAALISPLMLLGKKRSHYLTIGYTDPGGKQQAIVLLVNKDDIRSLIVGLEARTGRRVEYQDEEARKAGKG